MTTLEGLQRNDVIKNSSIEGKLEILLISKQAQVNTNTFAQTFYER